MSYSEHIAPTTVPSIAEYVAAFRQIEPRITENQRRMLVVHHDASAHAINALDLAQAAGFEGRAAANLWYGKLGQMLGEAMGFDPFWAISTLVLPAHPSEGNPHWIWIMRENVARALEELSWAPKTSDLFFPTGKDFDHAVNLGERTALTA